MGKKMSFIRENKWLIARMTIMVLIGIIAIFADFKLEIINTSFNQLIAILFSTVTVIAGLWISCYLLFLQLYKDRYPIKVLKDCYLPNMRYNFVIVIFCVIYGSIVIVINNGIIANLYYSLVCISTIFEIMLKIYNTNKSLMINTYVDKVFEEINNELSDSKNIIKKETFKNIQYILDESITKEEYFIVQNITERLGDVYRTFLKNSLRFVGENANDSDIEKSFNNIVTFNVSELKMCSKIDSELTVDRVIMQQIKNLKFCINKNQYEWFKKYLDEYNVFLFKMQKENNSLFVEKLYITYRDIIISLIDNQKYEWFKYVDKEITSLIKSIVFFYDDTCIRSYCNLISSAMIYCLEDNEHKKDNYDILFNSLSEFSLLISKNYGAFNNVKMCYSLLFNKLLDEGYEQALNFYENILEESFGQSEDPILLEFKMYCISELTNKVSEHMMQNNSLLDKQINVLIRIIGIKDKYQGYIMFPNFESLIKENQYSKIEFENIKNCIFELLYNCIVKDNLPMFYAILNNLNNVFFSTEQRQKEIQQELIDIYIDFIFKTRTLVNKQYLEITFNLFEKVIKELDTNKKISSSLGDYIITNISGVAQNDDKNNNMVVIKSIELLYSFLNENEQMFFVVTDVDKKKKLYRAMFNIGTCCIENNFEEGLRKISNALGWFTIYSIKQNSYELTIYLIERASELYKLSKNMEVSSKTLTYILTLFTTVGTFCCKNDRYNSFLCKILNEIITEDILKIKIAISLRTSENDTWNNLFDNKTANLSRRFICEFEKKKSKCK